MKNVFLLGSTLFLIYLNSFSQSCIDTSFRRLYCSPNATLVNYNSINSNDTEILVGKYNSSSLYLMKLLPDGDPAWAKSFNATTIIPYSIIELENKDILIAYSGFQNGIICTKFDKDGNLIWSKEIFITDATSTIVNFNLYEYQQQLYACCSGEDALSNVATAIIKMDTACNIIWAKYYINNNTPGCNVTSPIAMCEVDDSLLIFGRVAPLYCTYVDGSTESSYYATKVSKQTGGLGKSVAYRNPIDFGNNALSWTVQQNNFSATITKTDNGQYFLTGQEALKRNDIKVRFDTNLNVYEGYEYGNISGTLYVGKISMDTQGNTYLSYRNNTSPNNYIARFDANNKLLLQKQLPSFGGAAYITGSSFIYKENYTTLIASVNTTMGGCIQQYQLNNEEQAIDCFGKDTNFVLVKPYPFKIENPAFFTDSYDLLIYESDAPSISVNDISINKQDICQRISNCTSLKIQQQPDTVCTPIKTFIAHKNGECYKHIYWQIDSTIIDSLTQLNDTAIRIQFKKTGQDTAWLYASVNSCMDLKDSIKVYQNITTKNSVALGSDTTLCKGNELYLNATSGFERYLWQDSSADSFFVVKKAGSYFVTATDYCGSKFSDTIIVAFDSPSIYLGNDTSICSNTTIAIASAETFMSYLWSNGSASNSISINQPGSYWLRVTDDNLCSDTDTISVSIKNCGDYFFMPNSFTPNNDGLNDKIRPIVTGDIITYEFSIYNRYGQLVFTSKNMQDSWDGNLNDKQQNSGAFVWYCHYKRKNEIEKLEKGTILLVR